MGTFHTTGASTAYGGGAEGAAPESHAATKPPPCCIPSAEELKAPAGEAKAAPCCGRANMNQHRPYHDPLRLALSVSS